MSTAGIARRPKTIPTTWLGSIVLCYKMGYMKEGMIAVLPDHLKWHLVSTVSGNGSGRLKEDSYKRWPLPTASSRLADSTPPNAKTRPRRWPSSSSTRQRGGGFGEIWRKCQERGAATLWWHK